MAVFHQTQSPMMPCFVQALHGTQLKCVHGYLRGDVLGGLYPDGGVPLPGGQDRHLVQELVDSSHQVGAVLGLVRHVVEHLEKRSRFKIKVPL